jgi:hypothetical protein
MFNEVVGFRKNWVIFRSQHSQNTHKMAQASKSFQDKKRKVYLFLGLIIILTTALVVKKFYNRESPYEKQLQMLSEEINKGCPIQVDQRTRLDNTEIVGKNEFRYNYTLTNLEKGNFDEADLKQFLSGQILTNIKESEGMRIFREQSTRLSYHYKDKNGQPLFELNFGEGDYN